MTVPIYVNRYRRPGGKDEVATFSATPIQGTNQTVNVTAEHDIRDQREEVVARFRIGWDDHACYALFNVRDDSPLKNATTAIQELFKGGDAVGLCLGRTGGSTANQRIVAGPFGSGFSVMAMRPKWKEKSPYRYFTSASGELVYEHVAELAGAQVAAKASGDGYVLELALPWKSLGMTTGAGTTLASDAQVVFSNPGGTASAAPAWWRSVGADTSSVWDIVAEARLHPPVSCGIRRTDHASKVLPVT